MGPILSGPLSTPSTDTETTSVRDWDRSPPTTTHRDASDAAATPRPRATRSVPGGAAIETSAQAGMAPMAARSEAVTMSALKPMSSRPHRSRSTWTPSTTRSVAHTWAPGPVVTTAASSPIQTSPGGGTGRFGSKIRARGLEQGPELVDGRKLVEPVGSGAAIRTLPGFGPTTLLAGIGTVHVPLPTIERCCPPLESVDNPWTARR